MFRNVETFLLVLFVVALALPISFHSASAEPSQEESLEFINSYCSRDQLLVENGRLKSAGMAFIPANQKGDRFWGVTDISMDLSKVVLNLIRHQVVIGTVAYVPKQQSEVFNAYVLKCKTQNCATLTPPKELTAIGKTANAVIISDVPEIGVKYLKSCVRAFQHLSKLNGAKALTNPFAK